MSLQNMNQAQSLKIKLSALREEAVFAGGERLPMDRCFDQQEFITAECETHGEYQQMRIWTEYAGRTPDKRSRCPHCIAEGIAAAETGMYALQVAHLTDKANIPERFSACSFDNYIPGNKRAQNNLDMLRAYAQSWPEMYAAGTSLILTGRPGTGKNHLAVSLAKNIIADHQASVLLTSVMRVIRAVRRSWGKESKYSEDEIIDMYTGIDLLVIDEVGVQYGSDSEMIILYDILNTRYERMLPTVIISNLPPAEISQVIGDRLTDRLVEGGGATLVFDWNSYRSTKGAQPA
ncbi:ATP-binding protein [Pantoea ananatis]|uniref:ATP-binding protein n=1 Tax=Pantoea ananas TaxID=553 RepID=UPI002350CC76|nr:ATP-binding protein [Pantoea ananatis]MDC7862238.1 hypothetical protein [Pantoea ananatis]